MTALAAAGAVRFGINLSTRVPVLYPDRLTPAGLLELAARVEALGYDAIWVGDNFLSKPRLEAVTTLAAIGARTARVRLGTAMLVLPLRHTAWLALTWATLDQLTGGRTVLNVGVGGSAAATGGPEYLREFEVAGRAHGERGPLLEEQIALIRRFWTGEPVEVAGRFHRWDRVRVLPTPARQPGPPIWITSNPQIFGLSGTTVARMTARVGRLADGWMTACATPEEFRALWDRIREAAAAAGRDPGGLASAYQLTLCADSDRARARRAAVEFLNAYYGSRLDRLEGSFWDRDAFGTPDECAERIQRLVEAGVREFSIRFASTDQAGQLDRFSEDIWPRVRAVRPRDQAPADRVAPPQPAGGGEGAR
jgi:alkanesulfonate monooxygenase SsuD/methylene tetrahydromethanopterin reductase-like flavin-dependent oxidoreductase (luciferase family)